MDENDAVKQLAGYLNLSTRAIAIAEGWSTLPLKSQNKVKRIIDNNIASLSPTIKVLYKNARSPDQVRYNRIAQRIQARRDK